MPERSEQEPYQSFSERDPRMDMLKQKWQALSSQEQQPILDVLQTSLVNAQADIIAMRSQDIVTTLLELIDGFTNVHGPADTTDRTMSKEAGWFYTAAVYTHPLYSEERPELFPESLRSSGSFYESAFDNTTIYASELALSTAFWLNVVPLFKPNWKEAVTEYMQKLDEDMRDPEYDFALLMENFVGRIKFDLAQLDKKGVSLDFALTKPNQYRFFAFFKTLVRTEFNANNVMKFLQKVTHERGGVLIAFNKNVLAQGEVQTEWTNSGGPAHGGEELVIRPENGIIDLRNTLIAFEALGVYEDEVLAELGIL